jgi:hypothetical protein
MAPSRTRTIGLVTAVASAVLALRPVGPLEELLDVALLPGRVLASLAAPVGALQGREGARAAEQRALRDEQDLERHRDLEARVRLAAWPTSVALKSGVGTVQAEVVGHASQDLDVLRLVVSEPERIALGQPVVAGDAFVGLVARIPGREPPPPGPRGFLERIAARVGLRSRPPVVAPSEVFVELVTGPRARIGAMIAEADDGGTCRLVVGGLAPLARTPLLAIHNPERRAVRGGLVEVREPAPKDAPERGTRRAGPELAEGFLIGELDRVSAPVRGADFERQVLGVRPYLDYESGLHQVLVLTDDGIRRPAPERERTALADGGWSPAVFFLRAEPIPWREGRKLDRGRRHGVVTGSAVATGARLVGRVVRVGLVTSDVALLGDPGLTLSVLADPVGGERQAPLVLGRIVSLGRIGTGAVRFLWRPQRDVFGEGLAPAASHGAGLRVTLWTGSGEAGVPRGLLVGETALPVGAGPHEILVEQPADARAPKALRVRLAPQAGFAGEGTVR